MLHEALSNTFIISVRPQATIKESTTDRRLEEIRETLSEKAVRIMGFQGTRGRSLIIEANKDSLWDIQRCLDTRHPNCWQINSWDQGTQSPGMLALNHS
ncbi:MAG: hypothetical protein KDJ50_06960 [Alphaproteobacteria bacterium]|nr:hypothetical protein [Alphaproteobacteria bacterium]